jgi:2-haloacid dehalogenase
LPLTKAASRDLVQAYRSLHTFPEVTDALAGLRDCRLAILSNGSPEMLNAVVRHSGLDRLLDKVISVDEVRIFKPHPTVYRLAPDRLQVRTKIGFVSSNYWDVQAAAFGFRLTDQPRKATPDNSHLPAAQAASDLR